MFWRRNIFMREAATTLAEDAIFTELHNCQISFRWLSATQLQLQTSQQTEERKKEERTHRLTDDTLKTSDDVSSANLII